MNTATAVKPTLRVDKLSKSYPVADGQLTVLRDVSFNLDGGDAMAVIGPSGCGKSSLLYLLGGLDRPTAGKILVNDREPALMKEDDLAAFRNQTIGFVFQDHYLLPQCTVLENVLVPTLAQGGATLATTARAKELIDRVGLSQRIKHRPAELSGGERQRAAIARALIHEPSLLLADEPTGNLDRQSAAQVADLLAEIYKSAGAILILVTHSLDLAARLPKRFELIDGQLNAGANG